MCIRDSIQLDEAEAETSRFAESLELDPEGLRATEERLSALHDLARKHRVQPDALSELLTDLHTELEALTGGSEQLEALEKAMADTALAWRTQADKLSALRQQGAIKLSQRVMECWTGLRWEGAYLTSR